MFSKEEQDILDDYYPAIDQIVTDLMSCKRGKENPNWAVDVCLAAALKISTGHKQAKELRRKVEELMGALDFLILLTEATKIFGGNPDAKDK